VRIKVDEDLPRAVAALLVEAGHEAATVLDQGLGGVSDEALWPIVQEEQRFLVTADKGFGDIRRYPPGSHPGIVVLRPREDGIRPLLHLVRSLLATCRLDELAGLVTSVTPAGIRAHRSLGERMGGRTNG
jgi:predicted nuclease of predicted toxin-antitoxin system